MGTQLLVKMDAEMKDQLVRLARSEGKTASQVVRELVESYLRERDIASYVDSLWQRIGADLKTKGITLRHVEESVQAVRKPKTNQ